MSPEPFWTELCDPSHLLKLEIGNVKPKDHAFLTGLIELFTDPANRAIADRIRGGRFAVQCNPKDGKPHLVDLSAETPQLPPGEMVLFFARFNDAEWQLLKPRKPELVRHFLSSRAQAESYVKRILGYLPKPVKIKFARE